MSLNNRQEINMKIKKIIGFINKGVDSFFARKLRKDRAQALRHVMWLVILAGVVSGVSFGVQWGLSELHNIQISRAQKQYDTDDLSNTHYKGKHWYSVRDYEKSLSEFSLFISKFSPILYTENIPLSIFSNAEGSEKVDEAIIKVLLSLRKLNRHDEMANHVRKFKKKFPESELVTIFDTDQKSILELYYDGMFSLYNRRQDRLESARLLDRLAEIWRDLKDYEASVENFRLAAESRYLARKTFKDAREDFEKLLTYELLQEAPYSELKGEALYFIAKSLFIEGKYRRAYQEFDKITTVEFSNYPDLQDDAMYYTAYCLIQRGIYEEAFGRYTEFMVKFPDSEYITDTYFDLGRIYSSRKEYNNARRCYEIALQREKNKSDTVKNLLEEANTSSVDEKAESSVKEVQLQLDYKSRIIIYRSLASKYQEDDFFTEALYSISNFPRRPKNWDDIKIKITEYEDFVTNHGQHREASLQNLIGRTYYDQGNDELNREKAKGFYQKTIDNYELLLAKYPKSVFSPNAKLIIANIYNKLEKHEESIKKYNRIINDFDTDYKKGSKISVTISEVSKETDPRVFAAYEIGEAYSEMKDDEQALKWYKKIIAKNGFKLSDTSDALDFRSDSLAPNALYSTMKSLSRLKRYDELDNIATKYIEDLRKPSPILSAETQFNFAEIKRGKLKQYKEAALEYGKLSHRFEENENGKVSGYLPMPNLWFNLIKLHGKYYEGVCYEEAANQKDANSDPFVLETSAIKAYKEATTLFKTTFQPLIDAPNIDVTDRDYYITESTRIFKKLVDRRSKDEDAAYWQYLSGEFYFAKKDFKNAIAEYRKVLKVYPTSDYLKDARDRIEEIRQKLGDKIGVQIGNTRQSDNSESLGKAQTENQLTPEEIAQIASDSTVTIAMNIGFGSGFFVAPGLIATNFHVIAGQTKGYAYHINKNLAYAIVGVVATDEKRDLAILKARAFDVSPLPLGDSDNVEVGETVYAAGSPKGQIDTISDGIVSRSRPFENVRLNNGQIIRAKRLQITAPISRGSSGGPLLNSNGKVIGINHAGDSNPDAQNINFAIPVNYLEELLKRVGTPEPLKNFSITSR